jgi:sortase (surface protein transpeptidase)
MNRDARLTGRGRSIGLLIALTLVLSLLTPLATAAQDQDADLPTTEALSEVPSTGARRPDPVNRAGSRQAVSEPTPTPTPREGVAPVELHIASVGVDAPIERGAIVNGAMQDPSGPWVVSWYEPLGKIGEDGNVVMAGHVDYFNLGLKGTPGPAVFWNVRDLPEGDIIRVIGEDGKTYDYAVQWTQAYAAADLTPDVMQLDVVGDTGEETLTLITCSGQFNHDIGEYTQRWVVRAHQV